MWGPSLFSGGLISALLQCAWAGGFLEEEGGQTPSIMTHQDPFGKRGGLCSELKAESSLQWCAAQLHSAAFGKELGE